MIKWVKFVDQIGKLIELDMNKNKNTSNTTIQNKLMSTEMKRTNEKKNCWTLRAININCLTVLQGNRTSWDLLRCQNKNSNIDSNSTITYMDEYNTTEFIQAVHTYAYVCSAIFLWKQVDSCSILYPEMELLLTGYYFIWLFQRLLWLCCKKISVSYNTKRFNSDMRPRMNMRIRNLNNFHFTESLLFLLRFLKIWDIISFRTNSFFLLKLA